MNRLVRLSVWIQSNVWGHFSNRSSERVEESSGTRCSSRSRFTPVSESKYSPFVALQFRETKGHVTETWRSTSAGICAPPFATMRSLTHRWVSPLYRSEVLVRPGEKLQRNTNVSLLKTPDELFPLFGLLAARLWSGDLKRLMSVISLDSSRTTRPWTCSAWITCWKTAGAASTVRASCTSTTAHPSFYQRFVADASVTGSDPITAGHPWPVRCSVLPRRCITLTSILISPSPARR